MENLIIPRHVLQVKLFFATEEYTKTDAGYELGQRSKTLEDQVRDWQQEHRHQIGFVSAPTLSRLDLPDGSVCYTFALSVLYTPAEATRDPRTSEPPKTETPTAATGGIPPFGELSAARPQLVGREQSLGQRGGAVPEGS